MGLFTKDIKSLDDLFVHTLQDIYYAENQIDPVAHGSAREPGSVRCRQRLAGRVIRAGRAGRRIFLRCTTSTTATDGSTPRTST